MNNNKTKCYISGKVIGATEAELNKFYNAEASILKAGMIPINPLREVPKQTELSWFDYMRADIVLLMGCQKIVLLDNYKESRGAILEKYIADQLDIREYEIKKDADKMGIEILNCSPNSTITVFRKVSLKEVLD